MPASETKLLSVRLPEGERRRIKMMAASQGVTIRQAIHEAFDAWALQLQSGAATPDAARLTPAAADSGRPRQPNQPATPKPDRRPADAKPSSTPGGGHSQKPKRLRSTGFSGQAGWIGLSVQRRRAYRENAATCGLSAALGCRWPASLRALLRVTRLSKSRRSSDSPWNSSWPSCSSRLKVRRLPHLIVSQSSGGRPRSRCTTARSPWARIRCNSVRTQRALIPSSCAACTCVMCRFCTACRTFSRSRSFADILSTSCRSAMP